MRYSFVTSDNKNVDNALAVRAPNLEFIQMSEETLISGMWREQECSEVRGDFV